MTMRHLRAAAAAALACVAITSCSSGHADVTPTPPVVSPDPTLAPPTPAGAIKAYRDYTHLADLASIKRAIAPDLMKQLTLVATDTQISRAAASLKDELKDDVYYSGFTKVSPRVVKVKDDGYTVNLKDCVDTSLVKVSDSAGKNLNAPGTSRFPATAVVIYTVADPINDPTHKEKAHWQVNSIAYDYSGGC